MQRKSASHSTFRRYDLGRQTNVKHGSSPACCTFSEFYINSLSRSKERRIASSDFQSKSIEQIRASQAVQTNKCVSHTRFHSTPRLDVQVRPFTGVFSSEHIRIPQTVSQVNLSRSVVRNDLSTFWAKYRTQNFRRINKLDRTDNEKSGCEDNCVPGRLSPGSPGSSCSQGSRKASNRNLRVLGLADKSREVCFHSPKIDNLPRRPMEPLAQPENPARGKAAIHKNEDRLCLEISKSKLMDSTKPGRSSELREFCCTQRQAPLSRVASVSECIAHENNTDVCYTEKSFGRPDLVVSEHTSPVSASCSTTISFPDDGCLRYSMGGTIGQCVPVRNVDHTRTKLSLQRERNAGHSEGTSTISSQVEQDFCHGPMRQQNGRGISPQRRRHEIISTDGLNLPSVSTARASSDTYKHISYPREIQQSCRPFVPSQITTRMASSSPEHRDNICKIRTARDRPVRFQQSARSPSIRNDGCDRQSSTSSRCILDDLEFQPCLDIPTAIPDTQGPGSPQQGVRNVPSRCSSLGEGVLALRPQESSSSSSIYSTQPGPSTDRRVDRTATTSSTGPHTRSLDMWGWTPSLDEWDCDQISLLKSSWRPSTTKTYKVAWNRWVNWCKANNVTSTAPTGSELARFLADLYLKEKLSYNTILLHKSVVSTLSNIDDSGKLSNNVLVKHVLKSISLKKPPKGKPPIWNIDQLASYLENRVINHNNMFDVSRQTAAILMLCSGRRIHDLSLLRVDKDHCKISSNSLILWPDFGSKTDSSDHRQSGWKLLSNESNKNLDPVYWVQQTIKLLSKSRSECNSSRLFITTRGETRPASRAIIAGWIKTLLQEAGIQATPGSIRSAVASKNWLDNYPIEDILARGNWRSANTFAKFYKRQVMSTTVSSNSITRLFNPVT